MFKLAQESQPSALHFTLYKLLPSNIVLNLPVKYIIVRYMAIWITVRLIRKGEEEISII